VQGCAAQRFAGGRITGNSVHVQQIRKLYSPAQVGPRYTPKGEGSISAEHGGDQQPVEQYVREGYGTRCGSSPNCLAPYGQPRSCDQVNDMREIVFMRRSSPATDVGPPGRGGGTPAMHPASAHSDGPATLRLASGSLRHCAIDPITSVWLTPRGSRWDSAGKRSQLARCRLPSLKGYCWRSCSARAARARPTLPTSIRLTSSISPILRMPGPSKTRSRAPDSSPASLRTTRKKPLALPSVSRCSGERLVRAACMLRLFICTSLRTMAGVPRSQVSKPLMSPSKVSAATRSIISCWPSRCQDASR
jgi:hypothetical protein